MTFIKFLVKDKISHYNFTMILKFLFILLFFLPSPSLAEEEISSRKTEQYAQKIIDSCQSKSQKQWDSGVTSEMMNGSYKYHNCLFENIKTISETFFLKEEDKKEFFVELRKFSEHGFNVNHSIFNGACSPCGTMYRGTHINATNGYLEDILGSLIFLSEVHERPLK